jgi:hypothetical protein
MGTRVTPSERLRDELDAIGSGQIRAVRIDYVGRVTNQAKTASIS